MTEQTKKATSWLEIVENMERLLFYASLVFLPISILPLPWDMTEFSMGLVLLFFATAILTIELVKLVWRGRMLIPKGIADTGILIFIVSVILSTIFSLSPITSLWGYDFKLGSGLLGILGMVVYLYAARSFIFNKREVHNSIKFFIASTFISAVISIFSFYGLNVLAFLSSFDLMFTKGLPIYTSSRISILVWGISFLFSIYLAGVNFERKTLPYSFFATLSGIVHMVAIVLFSLMQGWEVAVLVLIASIFAISWIIAKSKTTKAFRVITTTFLAIIIILFAVTRVEEVRNFVGGAPDKLITQLTISGETSFQIATQAISKKIAQSLLGVGVDTFSISYNQFRPLNDQTILLNTANFTNSNNQIFNLIANQGIVGAIAWALLIVYFLRYFTLNIKKDGMLSDVKSLRFLFDISALTILIASALLYYNFLVFFLLLFCIAMSISLKGMQEKEALEVYVINWGIFSHTSNKAGMRNMALGTMIVFVCLGVFGLIMLVRIAISSVYLIKAETTSALGRTLQSEEKLSEEQKVDMLKSTSADYFNAIRFNPENEVIHRRLSLVIMQYVDVLVRKYTEEKAEKEKGKIFEEIGNYVEIAIEEAKQATEISPSVYANWSVRGNVYSKLVGMGLNSYTKSALSSLQTAAILNPLNYETYYNAAQLYILNNESDVALRTLNQLFAINPSHIPSLILAGEISMKDQDFKQAERYFSDAKTILEDAGGTEGDLYKYVTDKINEITTGGTEESPDSEEVTPETEETSNPQ